MPSLKVTDENKKRECGLMMTKKLGEKNTRNSYCWLWLCKHDMLELSSHQSCLFATETTLFTLRVHHLLV